MADIRMNSFLQILLILGAHWLTSMSMIFITKRLVGNKDSGLELGVFIVWIQNVVGSIITFFAITLNRKLCLKLPLPYVDTAQLIHPDMILSSFSFAGTLIFNNLMLKYISVAFYQIARSLTLIFIVVLSMLFLKEKFSRQVFFSCALILFGFYIAVDVEMLTQDVQMVGVVYGILASFFAAVSGIFFKRFQNCIKVSSMQLTFNNCLNCALALFPLVLLSGQLVAFLNSAIARDVLTWTLLIMSGGLSLSMSWITAIQIKLTSPLSHNISMNAKSLVQTMMAIYMSGQSRSWLWWLGNGSVMAGIGFYTGHKLHIQHQKFNAEIEIKPPTEFGDKPKTS